MARDLTTPLQKVPVYFQAIQQIIFEFPTQVLEGPPVDVGMFREGIAVRFEVVSYSENGDIIGRVWRTGNEPDWPAAFRLDVKSVYSRLEAYAEALGDMKPGVSEEL